MNRPEKSMKLKPESKDIINKIYNLEKVKKALEQIVLQEPYTIEEQIEICEMPAPPMRELNRGELVRDKIKAYGINAEMDPVGNVIARYKGTDPEAPVCVVAAHLDTVFAEDVDVSVRRQGGKLYAPGIACNARGVACMLQVIRSLVSNQIRTKGDILFIGTVGEEAEGDLRGVKRIFYTSGMHVDGMIALESSDPGRLLWGSTGSKRYKIEFLGPGGHSFLDFGDSPSATQALCRAGAKLADLEVPKNPKTTFSIGPISGGTTVNSIAEHAQCEIDLRSQDNKILNDLVEKVLPLFADGANLENDRWGIKDEDMKVKCKVTPLGHRPAGEQSEDSPVLQAARAAQEVLGIEMTEYTSASTDQNVPMSMGIPSTTLGGGGRDGFTHAMTEWYEPLRSHEGPQLCLLTTLALVGVEGGPEPMLKLYNGKRIRNKSTLQPKT